MRLLPAFFLSTSMACYPIAGVCDHDRVAINTENPVIDSGSPQTASTAPVDQMSFRGFFGYLEYDFDPDGSEGVPGFSALPQPLQEIAQVKRE
jgi:hypothetical protein